MWPAFCNRIMQRQPHTGSLACKCSWFFLRCLTQVEAHFHRVPNIFLLRWERWEQNPPWRPFFIRTACVPKQNLSTAKTDSTDFFSTMALNCQWSASAVHQRHLNFSSNPHCSRVGFCLPYPLPQKVKGNTVEGLNGAALPSPAKSEGKHCGRVERSRQQQHTLRTVVRNGCSCVCSGTTITTAPYVHSTTEAPWQGIPLPPHLAWQISPWRVRRHTMDKPSVYCERQSVLLDLLMPLPYGRSTGGVCDVPQKPVAL